MIRTCTCGWVFKGCNNDTLFTQVSRCKANHIDPDELILPDHPLSYKTALSIILSRPDNHHHDRKIRQQLLDGGVPKESVKISYGLKYGVEQHGDTIPYNGIVHASVRYRRFPAVYKMLTKRKAARRLVTSVWYLESNAVAETSIKTIFKEIKCAKPPPCSDILLLGWRRTHPPSGGSRINKTPNETVEGAKAVVFVRGGLKRAWWATTFTNRFSHFDMMLCRRVEGKRISRIRCSLFGSREHKSVPMSWGGKFGTRPAHRVKYISKLG